jgi:dolichyl-phosphate beta-glucosyltransferase
MLRHVWLIFLTGFGLSTRYRTLICSRVCLVVPCYNEAQRLEDASWHTLVRCGQVRLIFVDDGSSDHTPLRLANLVRALPRGRARALVLPRHVGRGEAVRQGLIEALSMGYRWVGYTDADTATPVSEILRLVRCVLPDAPDVVLGARVRRLGARVHRTPWRLLLGRLFAWGASWSLACDVYDTQCPAKFFRPSEALRHALGEPFTAPWVFDTELLARLLYPAAPNKVGLALDDFLEVPLQAWRDVEGSKLTWMDGARAGADLMRIAWGLRRRASATLRPRHDIFRRPGCADSNARLADL